MNTSNIEIIRKDLLSKAWIKALLSCSNVYMVGGCVRDSFREKTIKDIDLVVEKLSLEVIKPLILPYGEVNIVGESFAVIKFKPKDHTGEDFDIAIPRVDRKIHVGHKGFSVITDGISILDDLKRRDFTINSIAVNLETGGILDPFNGIQDIKNEIIKATDITSFVEDPLRIIRGIQFSSRFGYKIEENTLKLMKNNADLIRSISGERILEEFSKVIHKNGDIQIVFDLLRTTDADLSLFNKKLDFYHGLKSADEISFFYALCKLGGVNPADYCKRRLKCDRILEKDIRTLDKIMKIHSSLKEIDLKFMLSKAFSVSPKVMKSNLFPLNIDMIISDMKDEKIPTVLKDLRIDGDDILSDDIKDKAIGEILEIIMKDALSNKFNWKDRDKSLIHLSKIKLSYLNKLN